MLLNDTRIRNAKPSDKVQKLSDGGGLYLMIDLKGSKLWRMNFSYHGKQKTLAFGKYPEVSLADARKRRDAARAQLAAGGDPSQIAKLEKLKRKTEVANTFKAIANEFIAKIEKEGKADATLTKKRWLLDMACADLGSRPIGDITAVEILASLRKVEAKGNLESARRLRSTIGQVFRYAIATARAENDPTFGLRGALVVPTVTHRAALTDRSAFAGLIRAVWGYRGQATTKAGLMLMALLFPRPGELRMAEWPEFDLEKAVWTIPAERTKMRREHKKPLPPLAVEILRDLHKLTGYGSFAFPAFHTTKRPMSENTLNAALRRLGYTGEEATSHGFRASASSLLNESGLWSPDAVEAELAHVSTDQVRRAYHRAAYWDERVRMAAWWQGEIETMLKGADVIDLAASA